MPQPTEPGWWWWRDGPDAEWVVAQVEEREPWIDEKESLGVQCSRDHYDGNVIVAFIPLGEVGGEWGPRIPEPPQPKGD